MLSGFLDGSRVDCGASTERRKIKDQGRNRVRGEIEVKRGFFLNASLQK